MERNVILLRVENRADLFDSANGELVYQKINIALLCDDLFRVANSEPLTSIKHWNTVIVEVPLTANQSLAEMQAKKLTWITEPDPISPA
jgi:hypothetical protein